MREKNMCWILWAAQGVVGLVFRVPFVVVALVLLVSGALLYERGPRITKQQSMSTAGAYHGRRAAMVLVVGFDLSTVALLVIDDCGPALGLHTFGAKLAAVTAFACVHLLVYQWARRAWPAGSD